jgi:hypothetical protein
MQFKMFLIISWTSLSVAIGNFLLSPDAFGITVVQLGLNLKDSSLSSFIFVSIHSTDIPSKVVGFNLGVILPGLDFNLL